jgi:hypothetical protein
MRTRGHVNTVSVKDETQAGLLVYLDHNVETGQVRLLGRVNLLGAIVTVRRHERAGGEGFDPKPKSGGSVTYRIPRSLFSFTKRAPERSSCSAG